VLANDGIRAVPTMVKKIYDRHGHVLEDDTPKPKRVYDAEPVRVLVNMMQDVIRHGTGIGAGIGRPAAGKTGTTSDQRDVWFVGFTPDLVTAIWMGNDDNSPLTYGSTGGGQAAPLWARFMRYALKDTKPTRFHEPHMTYASIDRKTGLLSNPLDKNSETESFIPGQEPKAFAPMPADSPKPHSKASPTTVKVPKPAVKAHRAKAKSFQKPRPFVDETLKDPNAGGDFAPAPSP
jgi:penicillin-binding protein 1A